MKARALTNDKIRKIVVGEYSPFIIDEGKMHLYKKFCIVDELDRIEEIDPCTLGFFVNITTANGIEVYEGDVIQVGKDFRGFVYVDVNGELWLKGWIGGTIYMLEYVPDNPKIEGNIFTSQKLYEEFSEIITFMTRWGTDIHKGVIRVKRNKKPLEVKFA